MTNRLLVACAALCMVLACTPARQVAEQHRPLTTPLRVSASDPVATPSVSTTTPAPTTTVEDSKPTTDVTSNLNESEPLAPLVTPSTPDSTPTPDKAVSEALPTWAKEAAATAAVPTPQSKPQNTVQASPDTTTATEPDTDLVRLMEQMIAEMEANDGGNTTGTASSDPAAPYPGQVQQIGSVTIEYRGGKT